jgi:hypothetical protein
MKKLNITPGKALIADDTFVYVLNNGTPPQNRMWAQFQRGRNDSGDWICIEEQKANATLYADAHNTYHATQMMPSEMAERIKALEDALGDILYQVEEGIPICDESTCIRDAEKLLP